MNKVTCDSCRTVGQRRKTSFAPDNWFYVVAPEDDSGEQFVIYACSEACQKSIWRTGPGKYKMNDLLTPTYPQLPKSDPDEILDALEEEITSHGLTDIHIQPLVGKFMVTFSIVTSNGCDTFGGIGDTLANAFRDAISHLTKTKAGDNKELTVGEYCTP
jgi:hypothetical protein